MSWKKLVRLTHLWIGLLSGIIFLVICLSGTLIVFVEEALDIVNKDYLFVEPQEKKHIDVSQILENYARIEEDEKIFIVNTYRSENRTYNFFSAHATGKFVNGVEVHEDFKMVYADPYTGEIIRIDRGTLEAVANLVALHTSLFLGGIGKQIIAVATIVFFIQMIAGLMLWVPKNRIGLKHALKIKWKNSSSKRRNFDLHRTLGFYVSAFFLVITFTGIIMSYESVERQVASVFGGAPELIGEEPPMPDKQPGKENYSYSKIHDRILGEDAAVEQITFLMPRTNDVTVISGRAGSKTSFLNFEIGKYFQFNKYTGEKLGGDEQEGFDRNNTIAANTLLIHMGFWGGMASKVLTFFIGIIGCSLPVTGFLIWIRKLKKSR